MVNTDFLNGILLSKQGVTKDFKEEWGWDRYMVGGKMFAAICTPSAKYDPAYANHTLLSLKCDPMEADFLREQYCDILPGFYMDKINWISIRIGGQVPIELIEQLCQSSYQLIFGKLTKKLQREISDL